MERHREMGGGQEKEEKRDLGMRQLKIAKGVQRAKPTAFVSINFIDRVMQSGERG